jgi:hypothetical protein
VQRRELDHAFELQLDRVVDQDRLPKARAAVDDAVSDGCDPVGNRLERLDRRRRPVAGDGRELQARRAGIDDENLGQYGQTQSRISGSSSPCSRV